MGPLVLSLAVGAALVGYAVDGWFARYTSDDYCTAGAERALGYLGAQAYWYSSWSGRFTYFALSGAIEFAGPGIVQVLPTLALLAWLGTGTWALLPVARRQRWPGPLLSAAALSGGLVLICLQGAPDLDQALYWQTGMLTYLLPLVLLTAYAGWLVRLSGALPGRGPSLAEIAAGAVFLFLVGGISETTLSLQLALLAISLVVCLALRSGRMARGLALVLTSGLVATLAAAVLVVAAPGNSIREARVTGSVQGWAQLPVAVQAGVDFVGLFARTVQFRARSAALIVLVLSASGGAWSVVTSSSRPSWRSVGRNLAGLVGVVGCGWLLLMAATVPGFFAQQWDPPERAQFVAVWAAGIALLGAAYLLGRALAQGAAIVGSGRACAVWAGPAWAACLVLLALGPLLTLRGTLARLPSDAAYAAAWDALDETIRRRTGQDPSLVLDNSLPPHFGFDFIGADPGSYPNPCVAQFYGLSSIRTANPWPSAHAPTSVY